MKKLFCVLLLSLISIMATANEKESKIKDLMEAQGLLEMFENQMEMGKIQGEKMGQQMMDQMLSQLNPDEEFMTRIKSAFNNFIEKLESPHSPEEIVKTWGQYYGKNFSERELDVLIDFYTSDIGQKEVNASKMALTEFTTHFQKLNEPLLKNATQEYIEELKLVVKECKCKK